MSYAATNIDNAGLTEDYVSPTTDVWQTEIEPLQRGSHLTVRAGDYFRGWVVPAIESGNAFENADLLELVAFAEIDARVLERVFVTLSSPEKPTQSLVYTFFAGPPSPYVLKREHLELSRRQIGFYPDFFNIRKLAVHVMGRATVTLSEQEDVSERRQNIPITIHPEVLREAELGDATDDLETGIKLAREIYPNLHRIEVSVEYDPEILDRKTIRFTLSVSGEAEIILQSEGLFKRRLRSSISRRTREMVTVTYDWEK